MYFKLKGAIDIIKIFASLSTDHYCFSFDFLLENCAILTLHDIHKILKLALRNLNGSITWVNICNSWFFIIPYRIGVVLQSYRIIFKIIQLDGPKIFSWVIVKVQASISISNLTKIPATESYCWNRGAIWWVLVIEANLETLNFSLTVELVDVRLLIGSRSKSEKAICFKRSD